jgi:hypothetical protein
VEISTSVAVIQCLYAIGDKEESRNWKTICITLVTPESASGGVTYRHGVAVVPFFSRETWVSLWVTGVGTVLHVWSPCVLSRP